MVLSQNSGKYLLSSSVYGITPGFMLGAPLLYSLPLHCKVLTPSQEPRVQGENPTQFQFHLTHLTPLPGITGLAPLTTFFWPAVQFVCVTFLPEFSLHLSGVQKPFFSVFVALSHMGYFLCLVQLLVDYMVKTLF